MCINPSKKIIYDILLLVLVTTILQLLFLTPPILSDQMEYYYRATVFPQLPENTTHWTLRVGLILPVAVLYRIFGHAEITYYTVPFLSILLLIISVYLIGLRVKNRRVGLLAAMWTTLVPTFIFESIQLLPDIPATACITAGFALLAVNNTDRKEKGTGGKVWIQTGLFFLAGLYFGYAYLIKEYYLIFLALIPVTFWAFKIPYKKLIPLICGLLVIFVSEAVFNQVHYGDPLIRLSTTTPRETSGGITKDIVKILSFLPKYFMRYGGEGTLILNGIAFVYLVIRSIRKDRMAIFLLSWIVLIYSFFTVIGLLPVILSWEGKVLLRLHILRYWIIILPPFIIGGIYALESLLIHILEKIKIKKTLNNPVVSVALAALLSLSGYRGLSVLYDNPGLIRNGQNHYLELRNYLKEPGNQDDVIWINQDNFIALDRILPIYTHDFFGRQIWNGKFNYLNEGDNYMSADEIKYGKVIIDRERFDQDRLDIPDYLIDPPENWKLIFESTNQKIAIYLVN